MSLSGNIQTSEPSLETPAASDIVGAARRALADFGELPKSARDQLLTRLAPDIAARCRSSGASAVECVEAELTAQLESWLAAAFGTEAPSVAAFRCAFLDLEGNRRWPGQLLHLPIHPDFELALKNALPHAVPPESPLEMLDQDF
jgi:hypothetical protein